MQDVVTPLVRTAILMHGCLADAIGRSFEVSAPEHATIGELRRRIAAAHPETARAILNGRVRACVGDSIVGDDHCPAAGEVVEFLPPVSGG
jgi:molybdopterin converting factor small subunit